MINKNIKQGRFYPSNPEKYHGDASKIVFRSSWELFCFRWCDKNVDVIKWSSEETVIPYKLEEIDGKISAHRYFPDLKIWYKSGKIVIVEIKPAKETRKPRKTKNEMRLLCEAITYNKNTAKWKAAIKFCEARGMKFEIWTEELLVKMGMKLYK